MNPLNDGSKIDELAARLPEPERSQTRRKAAEIVQDAMNCKIDFMIAAKQLSDLRESLEMAEIQDALTKTP